MSAVAVEAEQLVPFLKNVKLFAELSPESLVKLGSCLKTAEFPPGEVVVREGAPGVSMYIIKSGLVEVRKKDPATGIDFLVAQLSEGAAVGEMSLLTGEKRSATVVAFSDCEVVEIGKAVVAKSLKENPQLVAMLGEILAKRRMETEGILAESLPKTTLIEREKQYTEGFLHKLRLFFEL